MKKISFATAILSVIVLVSCNTKSGNETEKTNINLERAQATLDSLYKNYDIQGTNLLRETFPYDDQYIANYLASHDQEKPNPYSYLWPYSGTFSAVNALLEATGDKKYQELLDNKVLDGLEQYFDDKRSPDAYASYVKDAPLSDRFYDDNVWLGIDFTDTYTMTKEEKYLEKAKMIWKFIESGMDDELGGGIYWCEQKKLSKNTCSNAPGSVYALKLFEATKDSSYFQQGQFLYEWTKEKLQDTSDYLYYDNINLKGKIGKAKYAYNSGQMMQAATLLYKLTGNNEYLTDAQNLAKACYDYFFEDIDSGDGEKIRIIKGGNIWFTAVMLRGFVELYHQDNDKTYIDAFNLSMNYAWEKGMRAENGLFNTEWNGTKQDESKWLLTQAAIVEMYARLAAVK